jgi:hypothetical protein
VAPQLKTTWLTVALILPLLGLAMYMGVKYGDDPFPAWFRWFEVSYIIGMIVIVSAYGRRIRRNSSPAKFTSKSKRKITRGSGYLILIWSCTFLWISYTTIAGKLDWWKGVPAGAFLLALIILLARSLFKIRTIPTQDTALTAQPPQTPPNDASEP